jgi:dolichol-phosphate mannosyltransferase
MRKKQVEPELAVVVPVKNEQDNVLSLIGEIHTALEGVAEFEVIYVDDGSDDRTPQKLREAKEKFPRLRTLRHRESCGQSQAVATGVAAASARFVATLDGDGQNDPADIPALLAQLRAAPDPDLLLIAGHRHKRKDSAVKRYTSKFANALRRALLNDETPDTGCGLKLFTRAAFLDLPRFDHMHRYLPALFLRRGGRVVSVPVNHRPREKGVSKYGTLDRALVGVTDLLGVMWLIRRASVPEIESADE